MIDHGREDDFISITEDDLYMYNKILYPRQEHQTETLLALSQLSILTDSESDDGSVRLSNDYYCTNSGSAGHSLPTSSQPTSSVSSTPTTGIDNAKL